MSEHALFPPLQPAARAASPAWRPWEMTSLPRLAGDGRGAARMPATPPPPAPRARADAAELERLRCEAREAGLAEGRAQGLEQGHAEGHAAGLAAGQAQVAAQAAHLHALADGFAQALQAAQSEVAGALIGLALDVARQVLQRSLAVDPECIVPVVQDLLRQEPALRGEPRLLLHPDDVAATQAALGAELQAGGWQLRADESISRGGCLVQAASGSLDASVETRWARVAAALPLTQR